MLLSEMSCVNLCLGMWTKKGMTASFLGIAACGYHPGSKAALHFIFNLHIVKHPHTAEMIGDSVKATMKSWGIRPSNVLAVITDNGPNMVKAFRRHVIETNSAQVVDTNSDSDEEDDTDTDDLDENLVNT